MEGDNFISQCWERYWNHTETFYKHSKDLNYNWLEFSLRTFVYTSPGGVNGMYDTLTIFCENLIDTLDMFPSSEDYHIYVKLKRELENFRRESN